MNILFEALFPPAYASAVAGPGGFDYMQLVPFALIFVMFYFLLIRPQQKKMQEQKEMLSALNRGDQVVTTGGIIGTISEVVDANEIKVKISSDVEIRVLRSAIAERSPIVASSAAKSLKKAGHKTAKKSAAKTTSKVAKKTK